MYTHVYTGNGKGKTTCAMGLLLRAFGAGKKIFMGQFIKKGDFSEVNTIQNYLKGVDFVQFGNGRFIMGEPTDEDKQSVNETYETVLEVAKSGKYDLVILDEVGAVLSLGLLSDEKCIYLMESKHEKTELVLTGRGVSEAVIEKADLVTEMKEVKHYFNKGVDARKGIEF